MLIKICGATSPADITLLAGLGVDLIGLWHGIPGGPAELDQERFAELAAMAGSRAVLVTFQKKPPGIVVPWVQLHGYQTPGTVNAFRDTGAKVIKVLHVNGSDCVERPLIPAYERAGVDIFLLDAVAQDGRVGSTGTRLDPAAVTDLAGVMTRPFLLAGGISAYSSPEYGWLHDHPGFRGIDVDTGARDPDGAFSADRIAAITATWRGHEPIH